MIGLAMTLGGVLIVSGLIALIVALRTGVFKNSWPSDDLRNQDNPKAFARRIALVSVSIGVGVVAVIGSLLSR
jgi:hypothetical protein